MNAIAPDVIQRPASRLDLIANVLRIAVEVAERRDHRPQFPDPPLVEQLPKAPPLGIAADHEGLADLHPGAFLHRQKRLCLRHRHAQGLFAQDMLAGFGRLNGPRHMHLIRQGIVDGVHIRIGDQRLVRPVSGFNSERVCGGARLFKIAGSDRGDLRILA